MVLSNTGASRVEWFLARPHHGGQREPAASPRRIHRLRITGPSRGVPGHGNRSTHTPWTPLAHDRQSQVTVVPAPRLGQWPASRGQRRSPGSLVGHRPANVLQSEAELVSHVVLRLAAVHMLEDRSGTDAVDGWATETPPRAATHR